MSTVNIVYGTSGKVHGLLDGDVTRDIMQRCADTGDSIIAEYVWIGGTGADLRSKARCGLVDTGLCGRQHLCATRCCQVQS